MDMGKIILHEDARKARAKDIKLKFTTDNEFIVLDDEGNQKYNGSLVGLNCSCPSFIHLNPEKHEASFGVLALCKHLFAAQAQQTKHTEQHRKLVTSIREREILQLKNRTRKEDLGALK